MITYLQILCILFNGISGLQFSNDAIDYWKNIFDISNKLPTGVINMNDVEFTFHSRNVTGKPIMIEDLEEYGFEPDSQIKFIIHGWGESKARPYYSTMTDAYLTRGDYNIIQVDWSKQAAADYATSVRNTMKVGEIVGKFIAKLLDVAIHENVHILGHSLGAHVAGVAGKEVFKSTGSKVGRITGLDPAGPLFEGLLSNPSRRLYREDANMVDIVHTDGGVFGYMEPLGTVDFFPNGGVGLQPGCSFLTFGIQLSFKSTTDYAFCSHMKSHSFYIESINSNKMMGVKCNSWSDFEANYCQMEDNVVFGEDTPSTATGNYYFRTFSLNFARIF